MTNFMHRTRTTPLILAAAFIAWFSLSISLPAQSETSSSRDRIQKRTYEFKEAGKEVEYALFVPASYDAAKPTPLIVLLHGLGSNPSQVIRYEGITDQAEEHGYIVVAPYGYNERGWYGSRGQGNKFARRRRNREAPINEPENLGALSEKDVFNVLARIRDEFTIDPNRIYLMGHSMGGGGTLYLGLKRADLWAGLAPMAPAIYSSPDQLEPVRHLPIIVIQGDRDRLVPVAIARRWVAKMKELEMAHEYIEIKDGNHVTSITRNPEMIRKIFAFFNAHARTDKSAPAGAAAGGKASPAGRDPKDDERSIDDPRVQHRSYKFGGPEGETIPYAVFVPSTYDKSRSAPLLVSLHGLGRTYDWLMGYEGLLDYAERDGFVVVTPLGYVRRGWYGSYRSRVDEETAKRSEADVMNVVGLVREEFSIDPERIYLWGHSMGGAGTYHLGAKHPDLWAGLCVAAPAPLKDIAALEEIKHLPMLVLQGDRDRLVKPTRQWVARMKELGMEHIYIEVAGGDHSLFISKDREMMAKVFDFFKIVGSRRRTPSLPGE